MRIGSEYATLSMAALLLSAGIALAAENFGNVRGIVHDPQHRPIANAQVTLRAAASSWSRTANSNSNGEFLFREVAPGQYTLSVAAHGFRQFSESIAVGARGTPILHCPLQIKGIMQTVRVSGRPSALAAETSTTQTVVTGRLITRTPGADRTNSLAMITDYVPGATVVHDMLHVRGGHQENWFFDGIPVLNTNIASNVGSVINPNDIEALQVQTGGYSPEYGDRSYGFFNVITPSGFGENNQGEFDSSFGNYGQTDDFLSFGSHSDRFAYFASLDGNRSDLGLATPTSQVLHDTESGLGGFASLLYNQSPKSQFRFVASVRGDHYQIPNTPAQQASGIRDLDLERDDMLGFTWSHAWAGGAAFTVSPFFHFNRADYLGGSADTPFILNDNRRSSYVGALADLTVPHRKNRFQAGIEVWGQHDNTLFDLRANPGTQAINQSFHPWGNSDSLYVADAYRAGALLTLNAGVRLTHYGGLLSENAADPRAGASFRIPRLDWILRSYVADYYQPPPLDTVSGPLLSFAVHQGFGFIPLPGERDKQWDAGLSIPFERWYLNFDHFRTSAANFLDHDEIGASDIFLPLTDLAALISGNEASLRSPKIFGRFGVSVAYSNQVAKGLGPITGGLIEFSPTSYFYLDHDQRNTVNAVVTSSLPKRIWASASVHYGSGFLRGNGPAHLPPHTTFDLSLAKSIGDTWRLSADATNVTNARYLLDTSNTFGGTHYVNPREIYGEVRYRFHF